MKIKKFIKNLLRTAIIKSKIKAINKLNGNHIEYDDSKILTSHSCFKLTGKNNHITLGNHCELRLLIEIYGDNNTIVIGENTRFNANNQICIGTPDTPASNCTIIIGADSTYNGCLFRIFESSSHINVGEHCLFSSGINVWASDSHSILQDGKLINKGESIIIGNHVWVGMDSKISKNTQVSDNSVIGWGSIVTKKFTTTNVIIAGNPAIIVKENIDWNINHPNFYLNSNS